MNDSNSAGNTVQSVDLEQFATMLIFGPEHRRHLMLTLAGELEDYYRTMNALPDEADHSRRVRLLHKLKSCAMQFGFPRLAQLTDEINIADTDCDVGPLLSELRVLSATIRKRVGKA